MSSQANRVQNVVDLALAGATVITGNTRTARYLRREAERKAWQTKTVCATPDIAPLEAWISRCWTECLLAGVVDRAQLKANVTAAVWEEIVARSEAGRSLMNAQATAELARDAWDVVHQYKLGRGALFFNMTAESRAFDGWMSGFEQRCKKSGWVDAAMALEELTRKCARIPKLPKQVVVFGFDGFTPAEKELWRALGKAGVTVTVVSAEENCEASNARVLACADRAEELRTAARWARRKLEENPAARIGVLVPGLAASRDAVEAAFVECLHPEQALLAGTSGRRAFEISLGRPLGEQAMVRAALRWLRLATEGLPFAEWSALLRSPYVNGGVSEANGRAQADWELRNKLRARVNLRSLKEALRETRSRTPKMVGAISALEPAAKKLPERLTRSEWVVQLRGLLKIIGWPNADEIALTSEEFQTERAWERLLADFGALDQVLGPRSAAQLERELERAAMTTTFEKENEGAPIQIAGPLAVAGESFDAIWFCGLSDEAWPMRERPNPLLPFQMQKDAGVPGTSTELDSETAQRLMARVLQSADACVFSWPQREDDREMRASTLLKRFAPATFGDLPDLQDWDRLQAGAGLEEYDDSKAPAIVSDDLQKRSTRLLEWQSGCPFRAFAQARLGAELPIEAALGASKIDRGKITETALEEVWKGLGKWQNLEALPRAEFDRVIANGVETALVKAFPSGEEEWLQQHRAIERERLDRLVRDWLEVEKPREPFAKVEHQQAFEYEIKGLKLKGRVDRVDQTMAGEYVVIDYKSGTTEHLPNRWTCPRPRDPQLPIYALHEKSLGHTVAGVAFAQVRVGDCEFNGEMARRQIFGKKNNRKQYEQLGKSLEEWKPELERLAENFLEGVARVDPKEPPGTQKSTCKWCHLGALCRVAEVGVFTNEEDAEDVEDGE